MMDAATGLLAAFLVLVGVSHGIFPAYYERLIPPWMPGHRTLVIVSGLGELALGIGLALDGTRSAAAIATVALFCTYVVLHAEALRRARRASTWFDRTPAVVLRVVVNVAYVGWAASVARGGR
jgi:uncharacterized membrane protein